MALGRIFSNSVWACATLGVRAPKLFEALDQLSDRLLPDGAPQAISNSVWACATLRVKAPRLFEALDQESDRLVRDGTPQNIANSVWSYTVVNPSSEHLANELVSLMTESETARNFTIVCCWSLLVLLVTWY